MKTISFLIVSLVMFFTFLSVPGCSGSNVSDVVCDYGSTVCDISTTLCTEIPGVPTEVCTYLNLACNNLDVLCAQRDSTESTKYQTALSNLQNLTDKLRQWKQARDKTK